jgi:hypothetical protein
LGKRKLLKQRKLFSYIDLWTLQAVKVCSADKIIKRFLSKMPTASELRYWRLRINNKSRGVPMKKIVLLITAFLLALDCQASIPGFRTDTTKKNIDLAGLSEGGPGKDGIPSIDNPIFTSFEEAEKWLKGHEPVIAVEFDKVAKAYPLQILIWHEIVNDKIESKPILVTFCPLCYSAVVFERQVDGQVLDFGVSGFLRNSDLVMYDRKTESLWQQFTGEALVGEYTGKTLKRLPAQIISFKQFQDRWPDGMVLSRKTGFQKPYGRNPYVGYDDINNTPFLFKGPKDGRLRPIEKVIAVTIAETNKAYPYSITQKTGVVHDIVEDVNIVIFHGKGAVSALDQKRIADSKQSGSTGVFSPIIENKTLVFERTDKDFRDIQTKSTWDITGKAIDGPLKGKQLKKFIHGDYFAFAWLSFQADTVIYSIE